MKAETDVRAENKKTWQRKIISFQYKIWRRKIIKVTKTQELYVYTTAAMIMTDTNERQRTFCYGFLKDLRQLPDELFDLIEVSVEQSGKIGQWSLLLDYGAWLLVYFPLTKMKTLCGESCHDSMKLVSMA